MKWFRHFSDAHTNEDLRKLRATFGMEGVGMWWTILEIIASKMDETDRCHATYSTSDWCSFLGVKQKKLRCFLEQTELLLGTKSVYSENELRIECRNLLKYRDEWTTRLGSRSGVTPAQSQSQSQSQKQIQKQPLPPTPQIRETQNGGEPVQREVGSESLKPEGRREGSVNILNGFKLSEQTMTEAEFLAQKSEALKAQLAQTKAAAKAEREHHTAKLKADAVQWASAFTELIPNCDDITQSEIFSHIAPLASHAPLENTLQDIKNAIEAGTAHNPKGLIIYRLKQLR